MKVVSHQFRRLLVFCSLFILATVSVRAEEWRPVTPAELALQASTIEKDADAEALFWEVRMDDSSDEVVALIHYVRVKIFTDRGREKFSKVDMVPDAGWKIEGVAARVIRPDGTVVELKKDEIYERTIVKVGDQKVKAKSFAVPGIEPGVIVEYRYREVAPGQLGYLTLYFQRDIPVQNFTYYLRPFPGGRYLRAQQFNMPSDVQLVKDKNGYHRASLTNIPAFHAEPMMPPDKEVRAWVMAFYTDDEKMSPEEYWKLKNTQLYGRLDALLKPNDDVKRAAAEITRGATSAQEKVEKLFQFCVTKIKNNMFDSTTPTEGTTRIHLASSPAETLKHQAGWNPEIDNLFGSLAIAAGLEAHLAYTGNRENLFFNRTMTNTRLITWAGIAVKVDDNWQYFRPGWRFLPPGMVFWHQEGQDVLIANTKGAIWANGPVSLPEQNREKRSGKFHLLEDGTLEGEVQLEYTGQLGSSRKLSGYKESPTALETALRESIKRRLSTAQLADIKIENASDPVNPFTSIFKIRVPGYAQRTGKRLLLQPGFFEQGTGTLFTATERKYDISFDYAWSEEDDITIELPAGFTLEGAEQPAPITPEMTSGIASLVVKIRVADDKRSLSYHRSFAFGAKGITYFPKTSYASLKTLFEMFRTTDDHTIVLRQQ